MPYALADPLTEGLTLTAAGGAFRSRRRWYGVAEHWEEHNLNAADEEE